MTPEEQKELARLLMKVSREVLAIDSEFTNVQDIDGKLVCLDFTPLRRYGQLPEEASVKVVVRVLEKK